MKKESVINQKLLICLVLMIVGTYAGRGAFMEPNCHKYRADGTCECCSFRFWMTHDGCCKQVSDQCKDWCPMTGKCTCCYLGYALDNGCCVLPCKVAAPAPKCYDSWKKCEEPVKKCEMPSARWEAPSVRWGAPSVRQQVRSVRWVEPVWKNCAPEVPSVEICIEPQSCKSNKSHKSCKSHKSHKSCKSHKSHKSCKSNKSKQFNSVMNREWVRGASKKNAWNKPAGLRVNYRR